MPFSVKNEPIPYTKNESLVFYGTLGYLKNAWHEGYYDGNYLSDLRCSRYLTEIDNFLKVDRIVGVGMVEDDDLILISSKKNIKCESRFVIVDQKVVAGSTYRYDGKLDIRSDYFDGAKKVAEAMASLDWQPDVCYTCDIALHNDKFKIIELNIFSCAGLYACDLEKVINAVNELRLKYTDE
jgi:hypothetical protein